MNRLIRLFAMGALFAGAGGFLRCRRFISGPYFVCNPIDLIRDATIRNIYGEPRNVLVFFSAGS